MSKTVKNILCFDRYRRDGNSKALMSFGCGTKRAITTSFTFTLMYLYGV
jgi:hypothetical protein